MFSRGSAFLFILSLFLVPLPARATQGNADSWDPGEVSYGELFLAQTRGSNAGKVDVSLTYNLGLGTPQYTLRSGSLGVDYWAFEDFSLGARISQYSVEKTQLQDALERSLSSSGVLMKYGYPRRSFLLRPGYSPINGLVNLFGKHVIDYSLILGPTAGLTDYQNPDSTILCLGISAEQKIQVFKHYGFSLGYSYFREKLPPHVGSGWLSRSQVEAGVYVRF